MVRVLLVLLSAVLAVAATAAEQPPLQWVDGATMLIEGKGWTETKAVFDRLPGRAEGVVRGQVFSLGRDAAGITLRFFSDSPTLSVRWKLRRGRIAMSHMAATGVSGLDLYVRDAGNWRWAAVARPEKSGVNESVLFTGQKTVRREFLLYLPLYNGVEKIELGAEPGAALAAATPDAARPMVFYGTSAVQGGCASRPGMAYPAIIGRRLGRPALNLGFSGNGKAEPEMAALLATLDPAVYVIDCLPNLMPEEAPRVEEFITALRARHPVTPILLVENLEYPDGILIAERRERYLASNRVADGIYQRLRSRDPHLHYLSARDLIGLDNDGTVDGSHPTDLGFVRIADVMTPLLQRLLPPGNKR
jgi:hypothetical protein